MTIARARALAVVTLAVFLAAWLPARRSHRSRWCGRACDGVPAAVLSPRMRPCRRDRTSWRAPS